MSLLADRTPTPPGTVDTRSRAVARLARDHAKPLVVLALAVSCAVVPGLGLRWWTHPDLLNAKNGLWITTSTLPVQRAEQTYGVVLPPGPGSATTITFRSAPVARFATNTAHATVAFAVCHRPPGPRGSFIGGVSGSGGHYCTSIDPIVAGTTLRFPTTAEYIIATSTPTQAGTVVISGADFDYSLDRDHWYRRGVERVDFHIAQRVS